MGSEAAPSSSMFFRILLPGFTKKLILPRKFSRSALTREINKTASVVNPNGDSWHVSIERDDRDMFIGGRGWFDLVHSHNLGMGYLLIFQYEGNSVFHFRVFDISTCEISYPVTAKKTPVVIHADEEEDEHKPFVSKGTEQSPVTQVEDEDEHKPIISECTDTASASKVSTRSGARGMRFEVKLCASNLSLANIPARFRGCLGNLPEQQEVWLKDPKGRLWTVGLRRTGLKLSQLTLGNGWLRVVLANNLKAGDRCAFEPVRSRVEGNGMVWQMKILKHHA